VTSLAVFIANVCFDWVGRDIARAILDYFNEAASNQKTPLSGMAFVYLAIWILVSVVVGRLLHDVLVIILSRGKSKASA
jgi:hypothetical protein